MARQSARPIVIRFRFKPPNSECKGALFFFTMANYVSNSVLFIGDAAKVAEVHELFLQIEKKQDETNRYHLPDFATGDRGHMLDIETNAEWINYETRWMPNLELLQEVARHYGLNFIARYEEATNWIYGEAVFAENELRNVTLNAYDEEAWAENPEFNAIRKLQASLLSGAYWQR
jgi:hypothetical protein